MGGESQEFFLFPCPSQLLDSVLCPMPGGPLASLWGESTQSLANLAASEGSVYPNYLPYTETIERAHGV
jgi:hypothetical protein